MIRHLKFLIIHESFPLLCHKVTNVRVATIDSLTTTDEEEHNKSVDSMSPVAFGNERQTESLWVGGEALVGQF